MTKAFDFEPELGDRLRRIYGVERRPKDPREFFRLLRALSKKSSGTKDFLTLVKSGRAVIGASKHPTKDWIITVKAKKVFTYCSYDTLMTAILRGHGEIGSSCPHCGEAMRIRVKEGELESFSHKGIVFLWGAGPDGSPGNPMCDHLHLFPDKEHLVAWVESHENEMGFSFKIQDAIRRLKNRF